MQGEDERVRFLTNGRGGEQIVEKGVRDRISSISGRYQLQLRLDSSSLLLYTQLVDTVDSDTTRVQDVHTGSYRGFSHDDRFFIRTTNPEEWVVQGTESMDLTPVLFRFPRFHPSESFIYGIEEEDTLVRYPYSTSGPFELVGPRQVVKELDRNVPSNSGVSMRNGRMYNFDSEEVGTDSVIDWWVNFESTLQN